MRVQEGQEQDREGKEQEDREIQGQGGKEQEGRKV